MTKRPVTNLAASVRDRLLRQARAGELSFQLVLIRYYQERLLARLEVSRYNRNLVLISLALVNGRLKDFFDVYQLAHTEAFDGALLHEAVGNTFHHRGTGFDPNHPIFDDTFGIDSERQRHWTAFLRRTGLQSAPEQFADVAVLVRVFLLPIYEACATETGFQGTWSTDTLTWTRTY